MQQIVCGVCGRRTMLAPGTTGACPSCGAPLTAPSSAPALASTIDDDSATRPSIPPIAEGAAPIPAAMPASPATDVADETTKVAMPVEGPQTPDASEVTADYPMAPKPERTETIPAQALPDTESQTRPVQPVEPVAPPAQPGETPVAAPSTPPARKRSPLGLISIILLIVLLLAIGAAAVLYANGRLPFLNPSPTPTAAATVTPEPTPTAIISLTNTFTDADHIFSVGYPSGWLLQTANVPGGASRLVVISNPTIAASFSASSFTGTDQTAQQVVDQALTLAGGSSGISNRSPVSTAIIGGESWAQESGDVTLPINNAPTVMHATAYAVIHGNHTIYMFTLAPADTYVQVAPIFEAMLHSFAFL